MSDTSEQHATLQRNLHKIGNTCTELVVMPGCLHLYIHIN